MKVRWQCERVENVYRERTWPIWSTLQSRNADRFMWVFVSREIGHYVLHYCHYNQLSKAGGRIGCVTGGRNEWVMEWQHDNRRKWGRMEGLDLMEWKTWLGDKVHFVFLQIVPSVLNAPTSISPKSVILLWTTLTTVIDCVLSLGLIGTLACETYLTNAICNQLNRLRISMDSNMQQTWSY